MDDSDRTGKGEGEGNKGGDPNLEGGDEGFFDKYDREWEGVYFPFERYDTDDPTRRLGAVSLEGATQAVGLFVQSVTVPTRNGGWEAGVIFTFIAPNGEHLNRTLLVTTGGDAQMLQIQDLLLQVTDDAIRIAEWKRQQN